MTTIPSRLAYMSKNSISQLESRKRVIQLYRDWHRSAPEIISLYGLNVTPADIRRAVRLRFERNRYVSDPKVIDILIHKGRADWQEVLNCWSQEPHILGILLSPQDRPQRNFLEKFYEGRDEDQVLPAASGIINQ